MRKTKRTAKFGGLDPRRYEDIKEIVAAETDPKRFGTFEKQGPARVMIFSNSILGITLVSAPVSLLHTTGTVLLWYGLAVSSTVVKALLRLLLFMLSTSCDPRNISSSIKSELFFCLPAVWFCTSCACFLFWQTLLK